MILEALVHADASFVTLTYADEHLPEGGSLVPKHPQLYLKRLRKSVEPHLVRYFLVGEYGDETDRPHYHLALFGIPPEFGALSEGAWDYGHVHTGTLTLQSAHYIAGYVTKKLTRKDDERLNGRYPEFARMSLRPGIGAIGIFDVAQALQNKHGWDSISRTGDVPNTLRHGSREMPLGRYLRRVLRKEMNFAEIGGQTDAEKKIAFKKSAEMLLMYERHLASGESKPFAKVMEEIREQKRLQAMRRRAIFNGVKKL